MQPKQELQLLLSEKARRSSIERERQELPKSLSKYIRAAWHVVEPATEFIPNWHIDAISDHLEAVTRGEVRRLMVLMPPRHMKELADGTPICTPLGWRTHGEILPGDEVFGSDGRAQRVLSVSKKDVADYEVEFSTGETIKCNGGHLWTVWDRCGEGSWRTLDTRYLFEATKPKDRSRFLIQDTPPLQFGEKPLPLHPYFLGVWLGDGGAVASNIAHDRRDNAHIKKLENLGYRVTAQWENGGNGARTNFGGDQGIPRALRSLGIFGNKRIPDIYLTASDEQRMELLAGLVDTDGHVDPTGRVRLCTIDPGLRDDYMRLVHSLGFRGYCYEGEAQGYGNYGPSSSSYYQVGFQATRALRTAIPRKQPQRVEPEKRKRAIVSVRKARVLEMGHCLRVENPNGLYVAGETNVVTHNSLCISVMWPTWTWTFNPSYRFLFASYAQVLSTRDALKSRRILQSQWYQDRWGANVTLTGDQNAKMRYENTLSGYRIATSVEGVATGEGGDAVVVDDPHSVNEVESDIKRDAVIDWWDQVMSTRLNDPKTGVRVLVMQRSHESDLAGHVLKKGGWEVLCLPAEYEGDKKKTIMGWADPRTKLKELLWPDRFGRKELEELKVELGSDYAVAGQLQQRPAPQEGGIFKKGMFRLWPCDKKLPSFTMIVQSYDTAFTEETSADFTACAVWGLFDFKGKACVMLVDAWHERMEYPKLRRRVKVDMHAKYGEEGHEKAVDIILIEKKGSGISLIQDLAAINVQAWPYDPERSSKLIRAHASTPFMAAGCVFVPESKQRSGECATWADALMHECLTFPNGAHDDYVDALTMTVLYFRNSGLLQAKIRLKGDEEEELEPAETAPRVNPYAA